MEGGKSASESFADDSRVIKLLAMQGRLPASGVPRNFVRGGGFQQIQLRTEEERTGIWGRQPPSQGFWRQL